MKLLDFWGSFQTNEKRMIKILLFLLPLIVVFIYLGDISNKISAKKLNLEVAKANFDYVYDKALNFQKYSLAQKALFDYPEKKDFIFWNCYFFGNSINFAKYTIQLLGHIFGFFIFSVFFIVRVFF